MLRGIILWFLPAIFPAVVGGQSVTITLTIGNIKSTDGQLMIAFYANEEVYLEAPTHAYILEGQAFADGTVSIEGLSAGYYAITLLHDTNKNGIMDKGFLGIPAEAFGFSNNPRIIAGPPSFKDTKVWIGEGSEYHIDLKRLTL